MFDTVFISGDRARKLDHIEVTGSGVAAGNTHGVGENTTRRIDADSWALFSGNTALGDEAGRCAAVANRG